MDNYAKINLQGKNIIRKMENGDIIKKIKSLARLKQATQNGMKAAAANGTDTTKFSKLIGKYNDKIKDLSSTINHKPIKEESNSSSLLKNAKKEGIMQKIRHANKLKLAAINGKKVAAANKKDTSSYDKSISDYENRIKELTKSLHESSTTEKKERDHLSYDIMKEKNPERKKALQLRYQNLLQRIKKKKLSEGSDKIPGGLAKGKTLEDISKKHGISLKNLSKQLEDGIKVELEHTTNKSIAKEIAMDHLFEKPDYYIKLKKVEESAIQDLSTAEIRNTIIGNDNKLQDLYSKINDPTIPNSIKSRLQKSINSHVSRIKHYQNNISNNKTNKIKKLKPKKLELMVKENSPTNNVGGGNIAGVSPGEMPPIRKRKRKWIFQRYTGNC